MTAEAAVRFAFHMRPTDWFGCCASDGALCRLMIAYRRPITGPEIWVPDPLLGHRLRPNLPPTELEGTISSNALGVRGHGPPYVRSDGKIRIVAIGDSFTFGQEVDDGETWPAVLASLDADREVVNLGAAAYGQDQALLALRSEGMKYAPDVVIFGYFRADIYRNTVSTFCGPKPVYRPVGESFALSNVPVPAPDEQTRRIRRLPVVVLLAQAWLEELLNLAPVPTLDERRRLAFFLMDEIGRTAADSGATAIYLHLSERCDLEGCERDPLFDDYCRSRGAACVDPTPALRQAHESASSSNAVFGHAHYTARGYQIVAEELDRFLKNLS